MKKIHTKRRELKWSMITMLTMGWFLPLMLISVLIYFYVGGKISGQLENTIVTSADKAMDICQMYLDEAVVASKNSSYLPSVRESYQQYLLDGNSNQLAMDVTLFMSQQYRYNYNLNMTALYFTDAPDRVYYCYGNNNTGGTAASAEFFKEHAKDIVQERASQIDTSVDFLQIGGKVYLVRNIMDSAFHPYAVIVMELNLGRMLEGLTGIWGYADAELFINGQPMLGRYERDLLQEKYPERIMKKSHYVYGPEESYVYKRLESNRNRFAYFIKLDSSAIASETEALTYVLLLLLLFAVPLFIAVLFFFNKHVNRPISELRSANREIERENYGYQMNLESSDEEFYELGESFNSMSNKLQYQFEKIYLEELALRDANIMALQSQINPHFLNNTLEIINWEARMMENYKVSGMIEALSTMLEATMNRKGHQFIPLSEELHYVEAYLYIISQRFGDKFMVEKEIDESLLHIRVPRLIIQPIVENAVEHGMDIRNRGMVKITVRRKEDKLLIEVMDNGRLSDQDKQKIHELLNAGDEKGNTSLSLGIRNVNKRLKIIYGPECGLTIKSDNNQFTVSTIVVKIDKEEEQ